MMPYSWLDRRDLSMDFGTICGVRRKYRHRDAKPTSPDSQPWGFIPFEVGIVSAEEQGFQAVSVRNNRAGNPLSLDREELSQSVDRGRNFSVDQRVVLG
jgi:hypothetical protein